MAERMKQDGGPIIVKELTGVDFRKLTGELKATIRTRVLENGSVEILVEEDSRKQAREILESLGHTLIPNPAAESIEYEETPPLIVIEQEAFTSELQTKLAGLGCVPVGISGEYKAPSLGIMVFNPARRAQVEELLTSLGLEFSETTPTLRI
jgi:hypothetical protein